ncbi:maleate cis-trans isomerase family protein [Parasedimentitalea psychrophila]|uniref:Aspartate/glutamate racemase family protein n=1 Tax=Parasedimentitalea psychrophila TaxID=2997337 RepID=A0A9Y2L280_9RHOB|nr:aspartate/glutamate racemase family protein [Parasedimentitalea psychrophila]WIY27410.1 aspartate/glutamate racemase family protein [Parasedimentitalea psychrophila]
MSHRWKLGLLTPSSNTIMEPQAANVVADLSDVSVHFARFGVTEISLSESALGQFQFAPQLQAAELLADAKSDVIAWGGTSGGWVGIDNDHELCRLITERTGTPATTSTLALLEAFKALGVSKYALVTPYLSDVQSAIETNFAAQGFQCVSERHLEDKGNYSFSEYDEATIERMVREVAQDKPEAIAIYCTNFNGTRIAPLLEEELGIPVLDSVSFTIWHAMLLAGCDASRVRGWGCLFQETL